MTEDLRKTVFIVAAVVWLSTRPKHGLPRGAVRPLPNALFLDVVTSDPDPTKVSSCQALQDKLFGGIGVDRGQMSSFSTTKVLSRGPVLLLPRGSNAFRSSPNLRRRLPRICPRCRVSLNRT